MDFLRTVAAVLIAALVLFPAATRAGQALDAGPAPGHSAGYHRTVDVPPDIVVVVPSAIGVPVVIPTPPPTVRTFRAVDDVLPVEPFAPDGGALRAPPARLA